MYSREGIVIDTRLGIYAVIELEIIATVGGIDKEEIGRVCDKMKIEYRIASMRCLVIQIIIACLGESFSTEIVVVAAADRDSIVDGESGMNVEYITDNTVAAIDIQQSVIIDISCRYLFATHDIRVTLADRDMNIHNRMNRMEGKVKAEDGIAAVLCLH